MLSRILPAMILLAAVYGCGAHEPSVAETPRVKKNTVNVTSPIAALPRAELSEARPAELFRQLRGRIVIDGSSTVGAFLDYLLVHAREFVGQVRYVPLPPATYRQSGEHLAKRRTGPFVTELLRP